MANAVQLLLNALTDAVATVAQRDDNPLQPEMVPAIRQAIVDQAATDAVLQHATNAEPWYRSRVTWGALIAAIVPVAGLLLGHDVSADEQASLIDIGMAAGTIAGAGLALYGRWIAKTPIGR